MDKLSEFKSKVDADLFEGLDVSRKAENADHLLGYLLKSLFSGEDDKVLEDGYEYLKSKVIGIASKPVQDLLTKVNLQDDGEVALAIASLGQSDSVNGLSLDVMRRVLNGGSNEKELFKYYPLKRLTDKTFELVELRGTCFGRDGRLLAHRSRCRPLD